MSLKRILIVENIDSLRQQYVTGLELADFAVDSAADLQTALELIEAKTFHVALVDLMLNDPRDPTLHGLEILQKLQTLGEGTRAIVISGQDSPGVSVNTVTEYGAINYIPKEDMIDKGMAYLVEEISQLLASVEIKKYGTKSDIVSILAGPDVRSVVWVDPILRILKPADGFKGLNEFLKHFCDPLAPLMPQHDVSPPLIFQEEKRLASGRFWSKGLGLPVELVICHADEGDERLRIENNPVWKSTPLRKPYKNSKLVGYIFDLSKKEVIRSEFIETL